MEAVPLYTTQQLSSVSDPEHNSSVLFEVIRYVLRNNVLRNSIMNLPPTTF